VLTFRNDGRIYPDKFKKIVLHVHHSLEKHFGHGQPKAVRERYGLKSIEYGSLVDPGQNGSNGSLHVVAQHEGHARHNL
jgi:hypothetical protein